MEEYFGKDILETLYRMTKELGLSDFFNGVIRISKKSSEIREIRDYAIPQTRNYFNR